MVIYNGHRGMLRREEEQTMRVAVPIVLTTDERTCGSRILEITLPVDPYHGLHQGPA